MVFNIINPSSSSAITGVLDPLPQQHTVFIHNFLSFIILILLMLVLLINLYNYKTCTYIKNS